MTADELLEELGRAGRSSRMMRTRLASFRSISCVLGADVFFFGVAYYVAFGPHEPRAIDELA
jgi:hypothetical protein